MPVESLVDERVGVLGCEEVKEVVSCNGLACASEFYVVARGGVFRWVEGESFCLQLKREE